MILCDREIRELVAHRDMIKPFCKERLNSYGYDIALGRLYKVPKPDYLKVVVVDPLDMNVDYEEVEGDYCIIPPNGFVLGCSEEWFNMPANVTGICLGRSSYARCGLITNVTPLEAGWQGIVTIEISNTNSLPAKVHSGKGISQVLFLKGDMLPERTYVQKGGRYQNQVGVTLARGL